MPLQPGQALASAASPYSARDVGVRWPPQAPPAKKKLEPRERGRGSLPAWFGSPVTGVLAPVLPYGETASVMVMVSGTLTMIMMRIMMVIMTMTIIIMMIIEATMFITNQNDT